MGPQVVPPALCLVFHFVLCLWLSLIGAPWTFCSVRLLCPAHRMEEEEVLRSHPRGCHATEASEVPRNGCVRISATMSQTHQYTWCRCASGLSSGAIALAKSNTLISFLHTTCHAPHQAWAPELS